MEHDRFHVPYLSDKIPEVVFHGQAVKTVAYLRVSTAQQDVRSQRLAILDALAKAGGAFVAMKENIRIEGKRDTISSLPRPRFDCRGGLKPSQVPCVDVCTCLGSQTPRSPDALTITGGSVLPSAADKASALQIRRFDAQYPCPHAPLPTPHMAPRDALRTARGGSGSLHLSSRRTFTGYPRQS